MLSSGSSTDSVPVSEATVGPGREAAMPLSASSLREQGLSDLVGAIVASRGPDPEPEPRFSHCHRGLTGTHVVVNRTRIWAMRTVGLVRAVL